VKAGSNPSDAGSISLFAVIFFVALFAAAGLVVDGGAKIRAAREASAIAEETARAGAGRVDRNRAYASGGAFVVDPNSAVAAARTYLARSGATGSVTAAGGQKITVTVTVSKPTALLSLIGVGHLTATKTAGASLLQGVDAPGR
jgi:hypothetical protein